MDARQIIKKIELMAAAMLQPHTLYLSYRDNGGWTLEIGTKLWIQGGTPREEIIDWLTELAISENADKYEMPQFYKGPSELEGVEISVSGKAPDLLISLDGGLQMLEQYEALVADVARALTLYGSDKGPHHRRVAFSDYMPEEWHEQRKRASKMRKISYYGWRIQGAKKWEDRNGK